MKRFLAIIAAAAIAASMTACGGGESQQVNGNAANAESASHSITLDGVPGTYTGGWSGDMPNGEGSFVSSDGTQSAAGNWSNGQLNGKCRVTAQIDDFLVTYNGDYFFGEMDGTGDFKLEDSNGNIISTYSGEFKNGLFSGIGELIYYYNDEQAAQIGVHRQITKGSFNNNLPNGEVSVTEYLTKETVKQLGADVNIVVYTGESKDGNMIEPYRYEFYKDNQIVEQGRVRDGKYISDGEKAVKDGIYDVLRGLAGDGLAGDIFDGVAPSFYDRNAE